MPRFLFFFRRTRWWWLTGLLSIAATFVPLFLFSPLSSLISVWDTFDRPNILTAKYYVAAEQRHFDLVYSPTWVLTGTLEPAAWPLSVTVKSKDTDTPRRVDSIRRDAWFTATASLEPYRNIVVVQPAWGRPFPFPVYYLPNRSSGLPVESITRTMRITLTEQAADIDYWVDLPATTPNSDLADFVRGQLPETLFIKRLFYPDNNNFSGLELTRVSAPVIARDSQVWQVKIQSVMSGWQFSQRNLGEVLALTMPAANTSANRVSTIVRLTLQDAARYQIEPPPNQWDEKTNTLTWRDALPSLTRQDPPLATTGGSVVNVLQRLRLGLGAIANFLHTPLLLALPLIPFVWILGAVWQTHRRKSTDARGNDPVLAHLIQILFLGMSMWGIVILLIQEAAWASINLGQTYLAIWTATLIFAMLIPFLLVSGANTREQPIRRREIVWWSALALGIVGLTAILFRVSGFVFGSSWVLAGTASIIMCVVFGMAWELLKPGMLQRVVARRNVIAAGLIVSAAVMLCLPTTENIIKVIPEWGWSVSVWRDLYFTIGIFGLPYLPAIALARVLRQHAKHLHAPEASPMERLIVGPGGLGHLLFAFYLIGMLRGSDISIPPSAGSLLPIAFLLALFVYPLVVKRRTRAVRPPEKLGGLIQQVFEMEAEERALDNLNKKFFDGGIASVENYEQERAKLQAGLTQRLSLANPRALLFSFGPHPSSWANAMQACRFAVLPIALLGLVYAPTILARAIDQLVTPFLILQTAAIFLVPFFFRWFAYAFFLGYFFIYLPGHNGWQKGLALALGIAACTVPNDLVLGTGASISSLLFDVGQTAVFLMGLGLWAFDYQIMRANNFGWRDLLIVHNVPAAAITFAASLVGAFSGALITGLTQGVPAIFNNLINLILPAVQTGPR